VGMFVGENLCEVSKRCSFFPRNVAEALVATAEQKLLLVEWRFGVEICLAKQMCVERKG
jgi:hypothetical protein